MSFVSFGQVNVMTKINLANKIRFRNKIKVISMKIKIKKFIIQKKEKT